MDTRTRGIHGHLSSLLGSEEAIYGVILVSAMIVVSNDLVGTSLNALVTVVITVLVFFAAHVYAGTIANLRDRGSLRASFAAAVHRSEGMLAAAVLPIVILLLGVTHVIDDEAAAWTALLVDIALLAMFGWFAVAQWTGNLWARAGSAAIAAAFGTIIVLLKSLIHH